MLNIGEIMIRDPATVSPGTSLRSAAELMHERNINSLVVCEGPRIAGILTSRDLLRSTAVGFDGEPTVADFMTPAPTTIETAASLVDAMALMERLHVRHLPVTGDGKLVGILSVRDLMHHRARLLEDVVTQQTNELRVRHDELAERDRRMRGNLELAGRVQRELLPSSVPALQPFALAVAHHGLHEVSGDSYDVMQISDDRLAILIADALGHGVAAAFVSVMARVVFHAMGTADSPPAEVLRELNDRLPHLILAEHFLTMCYAVVDRRTLRMTYASAGHPPPLHRVVEGHVDKLDSRGHMIGVVDDPVFDERTVQLRPGEIVVFYTDGVIESRNRDGAFFGEQGLTDVMTGLDDAVTADRAVSAIVDAVSRFRGADGFDDDLTCIALTVSR